MTRRRRKQMLALVAVFAVLGVLWLPAVHWRLIGWALIIASRRPCTPYPNPLPRASLGET